MEKSSPDLTPLAEFPPLPNHILLGEESGKTFVVRGKIQSLSPCRGEVWRGVKSGYIELLRHNERCSLVAHVKLGFIDSPLTSRYRVGTDTTQQESNIGGSSLLQLYCQKYYS